MHNALVRLDLERNSRQNGFTPALHYVVGLALWAAEVLCYKHVADI